VESIQIELEIDPLQNGLPGGALINVNDRLFTENAIVVQVVASEEGHGFGVSEIVTIALAVGTGVTSDVVASSIKAAAKGVIRRARTRKSRSDGSIEGMTDLIERERRPAETDPADDHNGASPLGSHRAADASDKSVPEPAVSQPTIPPHTTP
jgi:hypothetical protein